MEVDEQSKDFESLNNLKSSMRRADEAMKSDVNMAINLLKSVLLFEPPFELKEDEVVCEIEKLREESFYKLAESYCNLKRFDSIAELLNESNQFFKVIPKARTAKIVRALLEIVSKSAKNELSLQFTLCTEIIAWCNAEKRTFLRHRVQSRLALILFEQIKYQDALNLVSKLLRELKRLDDKSLLVETYLIESRINHALRNFPKARASLTAARTAGSSIYINPKLQAELDEMSGVLHCQEEDYTTAFSYFLESHEAFDSINDQFRAEKCLRYMILCKVLQGSANEVSGIVSGKHGIKYNKGELDSMSLIANAANQRSLEGFNEAIAKHGSELKDDMLIERHLEILYNQLLESNLGKIIEPFSCIEISHVAHLIRLPEEKVERKLSQMILDKKLQGILDQGRGHLIIYQESLSDKAFTDGIEVIDNLSTVMNSLYRRANRHLVH